MLPRAARFARSPHRPARLLGRAAVALAALAALAGAAAAAPTWTDEAAAAGVSFQTAGEVHQAEGGDNQWPGFPEIMGGGACWADVDNDGYDDLYLVNQAYNFDNPHVGAWAFDDDIRNKLYLNNGDGTLRDATDGSGADSGSWGFACSAADYDADGCMDLLVTNFGASELFQGRCDGTFTNATAALGPVGMDGACGDFTCFSTSSAWADYDHDGDLDAYVANYLESSTTDTLRGPGGHTSQANFLLRNDGGTFTEVAQAAGAAGRTADASGSKSLGVAWFDYDLDGDQDIYVANDQTPNDLFRNNGDGTFTERAADAGVADQRAGMGVTAGDYDHDGDPDLFFTHYATQERGFYENLGDGTFRDRSGEDDLHTGADYVGWGTRFVDLDRDGDLDIIALNGHTEWITPDYAQGTQAWRNDPEAAPSGPGDRQWTDITDDSGPGFADTRVHRAAAFGDLDLDGDVDIATVNNGNQTAQLLVGSGVENQWLYLELRQPGPNRQAIGARVEVEVAGLAPQWREVHTGQSYLSQSSLLLDVGLGAATQADTVTVHWPGTNATTVVHDVPAGHVARILRATGEVVLDTLSPLTSAALEGTEGNAGWFRSAVTATLDAADRAVGGSASGVAGSQWRVDEGAWQDGLGPATLAAEGRHRLDVRSRDAAGNQEPPRRVDVLVDLTPPVTTASLDGTPGLAGWWVSNNVTVTLGMEDALSGPWSIAYRVDGGDLQTYEGPFAIVDDGVHAIAYTVTDAAGNQAEGLLEVKLDHTAPDTAVTRPAPGSVLLGGVPVAEAPLADAPAVVVALPDAWTVDVRGEGADATSGMAGVEVRFDGTAVAGGVDGAVAWTWDTRGSAAGLHLLEAVATDAAGNARTVFVRVVLVPAHPDSVLATLAEGPALEPGRLPAAPVAARGRFAAT